MCDEFTALDDEAALARQGLSRRTFSAIGAAAAIATFSEGANAARSSLREAMVRVNTPDGYADCFFVHPARGKYPGVILWPDIGGLRDAFKAMARRLAASGFAVLAVNQFYRNAPSPVLASFAEWRTPEGRAKLAPMIAALTPEATMRDAAAFAAFLDSAGPGRHPPQDRHAWLLHGRIPRGSQRCSRARADRRSCQLSRRRALPATSRIARTCWCPHPRRFLLAVARNDDARDPAEKTRFTAAASAAGLTAEAVVYPADHGWCVPDSPVYDKVQADLAWEQMLGLYMSL